MTFSTFKITSKRKVIDLLFLFIIFTPLIGCKNAKDVESVDTYSHQEAEISDIKIRLGQLENIIKGDVNSQGKIDLKGSFSPIKSITFRMGSKDDRLRIYWKDGSKTDLPCTKEQSIWACG